MASSRAKGNKGGSTRAHGGVTYGGMRDSTRKKEKGGVLVRPLNEVGGRAQIRCEQRTGGGTNPRNLVDAESEVKHACASSTECYTLLDTDRGREGESGVVNIASGLGEAGLGGTKLMAATRNGNDRGERRDSNVHGHGESIHTREEGMRERGRERGSMIEGRRRYE